MNGLVAYGSSDDEDEEVTAENTSIEVQSKDTQAETTINGSATNHEAEPTLDDQAPIMGPTIPSAQVIEYENYEEVNDLTGLSEREAIRFLTQPSHPMTELPPSPPGSPQRTVSTKFKRFLELKSKGIHFNEDLAAKKAFQNPDLLRTMMDRIGVDAQSQRQSSLPATVFDANTFPSNGYKESLLESQQAIREQLQAARKAQSGAGTRTIDFHAQSHLQQ